MDIAAHSPTRLVLEATVIRADGTVDEIGVIGDTAGMSRLDSAKLWLKVKRLNKKRTGYWNGPPGD